ncbi:MAG: CDP-glycerol--glycerophosphate glycerophosphotransferase [Gammaproteobacteria bacterium]|nr:CDP-glycerol--glycerophosphate glycerophosphotransferase [Gammaproteobacteria bacterium]
MSRLGAFFSHRRDCRAFKRLPPADRNIVVYSESRQDWHHHALVIAELTGRLGRRLCYVASDPEDPGLHQNQPNIVPFCIGDGFHRILFFQTLQADVMLTQLLDLHNKDLKRSVHPVHYVFMFHSLVSSHMADHADSLDHYDTILCAGPHHEREIRKREAMQDLPAKQLIPHGYRRVEQLMAERRDPPPTADEIHVLLAPSWGDQTILNLFGDELVGVLLEAGFRVTLRPHFQTRWNTPGVIDDIIARYRDNPRFGVIEEMAESDSLFDSHLMITDWSGAGMDYGFGLEKPVLYFDVPPKSRNAEWQQLEIEPFESFIRDKIGAILSPDRVGDAPTVIRGLVDDPEQFRRDVQQLRDEWVFNVGSSSAAAADAVAKVADECRGVGTGAGS